MLSDRKRILIVGSGGAGKSTFALKLGRITGLPVIHLDRHFWKPNWVETPADEWHRTVEELISGDEWIIDGNYGGALPIRVKRCDAIVFLDFNRLICLWGAVKRALVQGGTHRPDMGSGCRERLDWPFLRWVWSYPVTDRPKVLTAIQEATGDVEVITLRTRRDAYDTLKIIAPSAA